MRLVHDLLADSAARLRDKAALITESNTASFGQLDQDSDRIARALQNLGIVRGDRVALMVENSIPFVVSLFGALKAGAAAVPIGPSTKEDKLAYLLNDSGARILIASGHCARAVLPAVTICPSIDAVIWSGTAPTGTGKTKTLAQILSERHVRPSPPGLIDEDLCFIIHTSGSTGEPKGVMLTHRNVSNTAWAISTYLENTPDDVVACVLPLTFGYGLFQILTGVHVGFTVLLEKSFTYPYDVLARLAEHRVTGFPGVPTIFAALLQMAPFDGLDLSALRYFTNAAAALPPAHIRRLQTLFPAVRLYSMYGLTECTRVSYLPPDRLNDKILSVGKSMPNCEAYIVDEAGRRVGPGVVGELVVRGANVMRGYWRKPEHTARRLRESEIVGEKLLYTGDQFLMDEDGFLYFQGRNDDIFKSKGQKISPREIENVLYELEAIAEAAVFGVPDPIEGHAIKACVVLRPGVTLTESDIRHHCRAKLENALLPKFIEVVATMPKTESGKIKRAALA